jgi:glycosyltransferase involved in cell wall biosynthesis
MTKKRVAIIGTNGIPARYGGYETLVENLVDQLGDKYEFIVYCSNIYKKHERKKTYKTAKLKYLPLRANGWQSIFYDVITLFHAAICSNIILYLGPGAGFIIPIIKLLNKNIIVNHGGLNEWEREKYNSFQRFISKSGHKYAGKFASDNIADNILLKDSLKKTFGVNSTVIRYGGNHAIKENIDEDLQKKYPFLKNEFFVSISRAQIDNNLHVVLEAFQFLPAQTLVMIANWSVSDYGINLKNKYKNKYPNIILLDAIYEPKEINAIRGNAKAYIHSHSFCGTSPSLVEAMYLGLPIFSFDVPTNRETTQHKAFFFKDSIELRNFINSLKDQELINNGKLMKMIAEKEYTWSKISSKYAELFNRYGITNFTRTHSYV